MTNEDIIRMAREAGLYSGSPRTPSTGRMIEKRLERFAALIAAEEREKLARWMIRRGYATGHGDSTEDLLQELDWQVQESVARVDYGHFTLTQTNVGIGERGMQAYEEAKKRGWVCETEGARGEQ
jgi:O-methyltransferase involved in polyketide biosynthesis